MKDEWMVQIFRTAQVEMIDLTIRQDDFKDIW